MNTFDQQARPAALFQPVNVTVNRTTQSPSQLNPDVLTRIVLESIKQSSRTALAEITFVDGKTLTAQLVGIECFFGLQAIEVIDPNSGRSRLIPYEQVHQLKT